MDTLGRLKKKSGNETQRRAIEEVRSHVRFDPGRHDIDWPAVQDALTTETGLLRDQVEALDSAGVVHRGLKKTCKRANKRGERAFSGHGTIEALHRLRKRVKYLYYQLRFVREGKPRKYRKAGKRLNELGDKLGRIHDLDILGGKVGQLSHTGACAETAVQTGRLIDKRRNRLERRCNRLYRKVFAGSRAKFARGIAR